MTDCEPEGDSPAVVMATPKEPTLEMLLAYAETDKQKAAIQAYFKHDKNKQKAMEEIGMTSESAFRNLISRVRTQATMRGYSPEHCMNRIVPDPLEIKRVSSLYTKDGGLSQWVIAEPNKSRVLEMMREAIDEMKQDVKPLPPIAQNAGIISDPDLLNLYVLTDAHIGMLAWHEDGGDNWDLKIAEQTINGAFDHLISCTPSAEVGFFCQLGDGLHTDGLVPETPRSKNVLDTDGRYPKIVRTAVRIFRRNISRMLEKYRKVVVLMAMGNHDPSGSVWLQECFSLLYEDNPRVRFVNSAKPLYGYQFGRNLLAFAHGDKTKINDTPDLMAGEFRHMLGTTDQTYLHTGHLHHRLVKEFRSAIIEQHATIAARDAHASHHAYKAGRTMQSITYHSTKLERARAVYRP